MLILFNCDLGLLYVLDFKRFILAEGGFLIIVVMLLVT